ncbi:O-glucosyltransferase rumi homolog, partial [Rhodamnia argentea]|uniref:O-glucosyltransferase rumi homolog n=1 Tax=Rhodamnia argentea TaxID=178133 RepID=A0A8B8Q1P0_9MYRT
MKMIISEKYMGMSGHGIHKQTPAGARWRQLKKRSPTATLVIVFFLFLLVGALVFAVWIKAFQSLFSGAYPRSIFTTSKVPKKPEFPLQCTNHNLAQTCPRNYPTTRNLTKQSQNHASTSQCPSYFVWIHEDLRPWKETGITRDMVERARKTAHFRLVILDGRAYVEKYRPALQTRDLFTLWGILQLLRRYPGRLPDLELMFDCDDRPLILMKDYRRPRSGPPPLFRYCGDGKTFDIVFPDWSFWGWVETNIKPWAHVLKDIQEGNKRIKWEDRLPYAYWRGNPNVAPTRRDLLKCNVTDKYDWNTRLFIQDWEEQSKQGYNQSNLEDQCTHRYKIYIDGWAWSVSEKYILACDSMTLLVRPDYYDFFTRGMVPLQHYWPIRPNSKCTSLKFAVEWGNNHTGKAKNIGNGGSQFVFNELKMEYVYDYMYHVLSEYARLLTYKPSIPPKAVDLCSEAMACPSNRTYRRYMEESMVMSPSEGAPCTLPPPFDTPSLQAFSEKKAHSTWQVEMMENDYWQKVNSKDKDKNKNKN